MQPSKLKLLLGHHLATNSFGLGRLFYKSSCQLQNFRHHGDQNGPNLEGWSAKIKPKSKRKAKNRKLNWTVITAITVIENSINCYTSTKMFTVQKKLVFALTSGYLLRAPDNLTYQKLKLFSISFEGLSYQESTVLKSWYTAGAPEQGLWHCFTDRLNQSLVSLWCRLHCRCVTGIS